LAAARVVRVEEPNGAGGRLILTITVAMQYTKLYTMAALLSVALGALGYRLVDLQVARHDEFQALAQQNTVRTIQRQPMRGQILDIHGTPLAISQPAKVICADPTLLGPFRQKVAQALAPLLQTNESFLAERLIPRTWEENGKTNISKYVVLKRKVSLDTWEKIRQTMAGLNCGIDESKCPARDRLFYHNLHTKSIFTEEDQIRVYPGQRLAAHVLGYVANNEDEPIGLSGIECSFNSKLSGVAGWRKTELDKRQRELVPYRDQDVAPRDGLNVVLTLDAGLQNIVESELAVGMQHHAPISISCIMVRPRTGEILAMATLPNFDPNYPGAFPMDDLRNRVISDVAEPGSTFKIVAVTGALNEGLVSLNDMFDCCMGRFPYAGRVLHDHAPYGMLTVENIITKSSNIGAAKLGIRMGDQALWHYIHNFGFGERTGIPLPGEVPGIVHSVTNWTKVSIAQIPMGQGIAVTALQMVMAMSAIANNGILMRPMLVSRLVEPNGSLAVQYEPQPVRRVASPEAMRQMVQALKTVPTIAGTAVQAHLDHYTVAGKTGTAQKVENGQYVQKFFSSFIGFFPADNPELCISVVMDDPKEGHFGGEIAAPIFHAIAERAANYLNIKPDLAPEPPERQSLTVSADGAHR
jgi:cell division protein FtsI/penicillin-binding protein 2